MSFLRGATQMSGQGVPRPLTQVDPDLAFGAPMIPNMGTVEPRANIMQMLAEDAPLAPPGTINVAELIQPVDVSQGNSRPRKSVLDIIGGISDVVADVGGAKPLYQAGLDAELGREREEIANQWLEKFNTQKYDSGEQSAVMNDQKIRGGNLEINAAEASRMGQAVRGLDAIFKSKGAAGIAKAWPVVARTLGIPESEQAQFAQELAADPEGVIATLNEALNPDPAQGSLPKEIQIYEMLKAKDPVKAEEYLASVASGDKGISAYQQQQLDLRAQQMEDNRKYRKEQIGVRREAIAARGAGAKGAKAEAAGGDSDDVNNILNDFGIVLSGNKDPVADMIRSSTSGYVENIASMGPAALGRSTPGQVQIGRLETIDNALVLALAGGKLGAGVSNADRDFFKQMTGKISDPNIPADKRLAAWDQIKSRLRGIQARAAPAAKPAARRPAAPRRAAPKPAASGGGWGKATVVKP